jgi:ABC-type polysaccharide/polyol phosphate transport system ATPase subunit
LSSPSIEINGLWKRFHKGGGGGLLWESILRRLRPAQADELGRDGFWALRDVNLQVAPGEAVGIIGANGAGKSTLLKVLSRVLRPERGGVRVRGRLGGLIEVGAGFHGDLTGRENIFVNGAILGMSRREIRSKFDSIVEFSGIGDFLEMPVKRYSSGMYVRLGFAIAAHMEPDVLLVDEVLSVGDVSFKTRCMDAMRRFLRRGTAILFVSHNLSQVKRFCDRVALLDHGGVRCSGTPDEAINEYSRLLGEMEDSHPGGLENSHIGGRLAGSPAGSAVRITGVQILTADERPSRMFVAGEPLNLRIAYEVAPDADLQELNFAVSVHSFGAGMFYRFESRLDGLHVRPDAGPGAVAVHLPKLSLGEGVYQIGVAIADEKGFPEHDWHDRAYRIQVTADGRSDGVVHQPRTWQVLPPEKGEHSIVASETESHAGAGLFS